MGYPVSPGRCPRDAAEEEEEEELQPDSPLWGLWKERKGQRGPTELLKSTEVLQPFPGWALQERASLGTSPD